MKNPLTCSSTRTTRWTGGPGARKPSTRRAVRAGRCSSASATPPATGATSWRAESFADAEVARALNRDFIPIKVDREERPDVDAAYMAACVAMTGSGACRAPVSTPDALPQK